MKRFNYAVILIIFSLSAVLPACHSSKKITSSSHDYDLSTRDIPDNEANSNDTAMPHTPVESNAEYPALKLKYAQYLQTSPGNIHNMRLYAFIDEWLHTPYLWGGTTKKGIDCSAFVQRLYADVYDIDVPRTSIEQFFTGSVEAFKDKNYLHEGDLVFFKTIKGTIVSHVGFYLSNHRFVNASSSKGVSIGNLEDPYWKTKFVAAGRIKESAVKRISKK